MHWGDNTVITCNHIPMHPCMCLGRDFSYAFGLHRITLQSFTYEVEDGNRGNILVNLIYAISVFTSYKLEHAFCVLKKGVNIFLLYSFQNSLQCHLLPDRILLKKQLFFSFYMEIITVFKFICFCLFPHTRQRAILYIHYLAQCLAGIRYSVTIEKKREK